MRITITKVHSQSNPVPPPAGKESDPYSIFWQLIAVNDEGQEVCLWVRTEASERGRQYAEGQVWDAVFTGKSQKDRGSDLVFQQARLSRPNGQGGQRPSQPRPTAPSAAPAARPAAPGKITVPRDVYMARFARLFFEAASAYCEARVAWERAGNTEKVDENAFWFQVGKTANQAAMSLGLECSAQTSAQQQEAAEKARQEALAAAEKARLEAEAKAAELAQQAVSPAGDQQVDW